MEKETTHDGVRLISLIAVLAGITFFGIYALTSGGGITGATTVASSGGTSSWLSAFVGLCLLVAGAYGLFNVNRR